MLRQAASRFSNALLRSHSSFSASRGYASERLLVVTAMGEDKQGKVTSIADRIAAAGGNLETSKIARMEQEIALIMHVKICEEKSAALIGALSSEENMQVRTKWLEVMTKPLPSTTITLTSEDRPGIVKDVSAFLCDAGFKIENIVTKVSGHDKLGKECFTVDAEVQLPAGWQTMSQAKLVRGLNGLGCKVVRFEV